MKRSKRMETVRKLKYQEEQQQAKKFAQAQQALQQEQAQLDMLKKYQQDYFAGLSSGVENTAIISASQLEKYQQFLSRLHKAIENQQQMVVIKKKSVEVARQEWAQANARLKALDNLIERLQQEEQRIADKQEQKLIDDLPLRPNRYE